MLLLNPFQIQWAERHNKSVVLWLVHKLADFPLSSDERGKEVCTFLATARTNEIRPVCTSLRVIGGNKQRDRSFSCVIRDKVDVGALFFTQILREHGGDAS